MASTQEFLKTKLEPKDVPGAKINNDELESYGNVQLKRWLECRGLKTSGNRYNLLQRCKDAISAGKEDDIDLTVDGGKWCDIKANIIKSESTSETKNPLIPPLFGWKPFPSKPIPNNFNYGHIYHYLLESVVMLGEKGQKVDTDLSHMTSKPLTKGEQYVKSGSVSEMKDTLKQDFYFLKAKVAASMRNESRSVHVTISNISGAVLDASFTCPASTLGRCNHVAALLLQLNKHCLKDGHGPVACTSKPCSWSEGSKTKNPSKLTEIEYPSYKEKRAKISNFDPRPSNLRNVSLDAKNNFMSNLKYTDAKSMWGSLWTIKYQDYEIDESRKQVVNDQVMQYFHNIRNNCKSYDTSIHMISVSGTEQQAESITWKVHRWFRVTASTAKTANSLGDLVNKPAPYADATHRKLYNFISANLWDLNPFSSSDTQFGIESENQARNDYASDMKHLCPDIKVTKTGFWVNSLWPELGCSPDGLVYDTTEDNKYGLVEIKCLKLFRTVPPSELFKKLNENKI